jgi:phosphate transport system substrate-binding protein
VSRKAAERPEIQKFVEFYLAEAEGLVREVNYVGLGKDAYTLVAERFAGRVTGSLFHGGQDTVGVTIDQLLAKERAR